MAWKTREREQLHVHVHARRRRDLSARVARRGGGGWLALGWRRRKRKRKRKAGRRVKGVIYWGKRRASSTVEAGTAATSLRHCTAPYGTNVVRSRVYERAPPVHAGVGRRWGHVGGRGGEISLRARVHGSRENREPTATAETAPRRQPGGDSSG